MTVNTIKLMLGGVCLVGMLIAAAPKAQSATIYDPFFAANPNVVGVIKDAVPFGDDDRVTYVNHLLGMGANAVETFGTEDFFTGAINYNGTVQKSDSLNGTGVATVSGWDYLFVKYDGPNGGGIVYALNGAEFTLFEKADGIVGEWKGGISGWTGYGAHNTPDGGSTLALLGSALVGVSALRRRLLKA